MSVPAFFGGLLFGSMGIAATVWAVLSVSRAEYLTAVVVVGFAVLCLGFSAPLVKVVSGKVSPRVKWDREGTTIRPDRAIEIPAVAGTFSGVIASILFSVLFPFGKIDLPVPHSLRFALPFTCAMAAVVGLPILWRIFRLRGLYRLHMTPDGFDIYSGGGPRTGAWPQVLDVTDAVPGRTAADDPNTVVIVLKDHSVIKLPGASFTSEGRALRRFVHFYWQHPDCRDELTDGKALARLENEDFRAAS